jgi:MYXO-CTERM domain-containing protein
MPGVCDPVGGNCISPRAPNGTACTHGTCLDGACVAPADDAEEADLFGRAPTCYCEAAGGPAGSSGFRVMAALLLGLVAALRRMMSERP